MLAPSCANGAPVPGRPVPTVILPAPAPGRGQYDGSALDRSALRHHLDHLAGGQPWGVGRSGVPGVGVAEADDEVRLAQTGEDPAQDGPRGIHLDRGALEEIT